MKENKFLEYMKLFLYNLMCSSHKQVKPDNVSCQIFVSSFTLPLQLLQIKWGNEFRFPLIWFYNLQL